MGIVREHTKVIDGITYTTETLPGGKGITLLPKIIALVGPAAAKAIFRPTEEGEDSVDPTDADSILDKLKEPTTVAMMLAAVSDRIAEANVLDLITQLLVTTTADKISIGDTEAPGSVVTHFDTHFQGRYMHLLKVVIWVGQVNFFGP